MANSTLEYICKLYKKIYTETSDPLTKWTIAGTKLEFEGSTDSVMYQRIGKFSTADEIEATSEYVKTTVMFVRDGDNTIQGDYGFAKGKLVSLFLSHSGLSGILKSAEYWGESLSATIPLLNSLGLSDKERDTYFQELERKVENKLDSNFRVRLRYEGNEKQFTDIFLSFQPVDGYANLTSESWINLTRKKFIVSGKWNEYTDILRVPSNSKKSDKEIVTKLIKNQTNIIRSWLNDIEALVIQGIIALVEIIGES